MTYQEDCTLPQGILEMIKAGEMDRLLGLIKQNFSTAQPNQKCVAGVTYLASREGWLYLVAVMDPYSHSIVG